MPNFKFTVVGDGNSTESETVSMIDVDAAKSQMVTMAGQMLKEIDGAFWEDGDWRIDLKNDADLILCSIMIHGYDAAAIKRA